MPGDPAAALFTPGGPPSTTLASAAQLGVLGLIGLLVVTGGARWPVPEWVQLAVLFAAHLMLLYLLAGLLLAQGLAMSP